MKTIKLVPGLLLTALSVLLSCEDRNGNEVPVPQKINGEILPGGATSISNVSATVTGYSFNGSEGDALPLVTAQRWTANFQKNDTKGIKAHFFGMDIIKQILSQSGCVGIRMYYALDDNGERKLLLIGVNANGDNLLPSTQMLDAEDPNTIGDMSWPCPTYCPGNGGL
ncbi:hypothetical protein WSM22_39680 [Cytophagales bacterium WSM2-2]|nr:hypothetical protein WSM22_39680 [Cytophagales bacterium WSM2-2]